MLYFSSTYLQNKTFQSLEDLFQNISSKKVALVFDSNIVVYYRDFYLNPKSFVDNPNNKETVYAIRYLNEQITRYSLEVLATLGVDESSRRKSDFSVNEEKRKQTHEALMFLLHLDYRDFDKFIQLKRVQEPIIDKGEYPSSMLPFLEQDSFYQHPLIVMYILCLKVILLFNRFESNEISGKEAIDALNRFMREDIDSVSGIMYFLCVNLFGGSDEFKNIFFPKKNLPTNEKLHRIFNGAIDLVFPTIINKVTNAYYKTPIPDMIPVFVSTDKRISKLHSLIGLRITHNTKETYSYFPELIQVDFLSKIKWTKEEMNELFKVSQSDIKRFTSFDGTPRMTTHLLKYVKLLEGEVIRDWDKSPVANIVYK